MPINVFSTLVLDSKNLKNHIYRILFMVVILAGTAFLFFDQSLSQFFSRSEIKSAWYEPARKLTDVGLSENYFFLAVATFLFAKWIAPRLAKYQTHPEKIEFMRRWSVNFLASLISCGIITHILKFTVGRQRPHKSPVFDPHIFTPFTTHWHWHSFSSGHSQVMFTAATMMVIAKPEWRKFWWFFAALVCFTRVVVEDHFLSDIICGATVGYIGTLLTLRYIQLKTNNGLY